MTEHEMQSRIGALVHVLKSERVNAKTKNDEKFIELGIIGIELVGELLLDIKRIADALEDQ